MGDPGGCVDSPAVPTCPACGHANPSVADSCERCGSSLGPDREIATVVFSDLKGSTALAEQFDAETLRNVLGRYFDELRAVLESHGGTVVKIIGDAMVTVFGLGGAPGDPARDAVVAVAESQAALANLNEQLDEAWGVRLTNRTGIGTGEIVIGEEAGGHRVYTGPVMHLAETLEQNAPPMEALLSSATHDLVADDVEVRPAPPAAPKGGGEPVPAFHLLGVRARDGLSGRRAADIACQECGTPNAPHARRCHRCDAVLTLPAMTETRRTVSVVFADPDPSGADGRDIPPQVLEEVMSRYFAVMRPLLERHGGTVETFIGDAVMAVYGLPVRHEDDALRAVRAAADMRDALPALNAELESDFGITMAGPIGVNTGLVVAGDASIGQRLVTGDAVNVAARLEQSAPPGEVYLGPDTYRLVRSATRVEEVEPLILKGKAEPVPAYRLVEIVGGAITPRRVDLPMVGRDDEMSALRRVLETALDSERAVLGALIGDAGVGKSRLVEEFLEWVGGRARVLRGRCLPYGDGITFWPINEAVADAAGITDADGPGEARSRIEAMVGDPAVAERLSSMAGLDDDQFAVPELFWAVEQFVEGIASETPLVLVIDDVHWAEPTLLDLVAHLLASVTGHAVALLCTARRGLLEEMPDWGADEGQTRILLDPLPPAAVGEMIAHHLGGAGIDEVVTERIVEAAQGNPLFVEQFLTMLLEEGLVTHTERGWAAVGDLADVAIPPSVEALLAARLDRLDPGERHVVEPASVIGRQFPQPAVEYLVQPDHRPLVGENLALLTRKQLVRPPDEDDDRHAFEHLLVRDAAYGGLLKQSRAVLHERFVEWADRINRQRGREAEFEEILGYHLEQAYRYWGELGPLDEHAVGIGEDASRRLASAGRRALARGDMPAAAGLLQRAAGVLGGHHPHRAPLLLQAGEAHFEAGDFDTARELIAGAASAGGAVGDGGTLRAAEIELLRVRYLIGEVEDPTEVVDGVRRHLPELEELGSHAGLARAWRLEASVHLAACRWGDAEQAAVRMIDHARAAGDRTMELRVLPILTLFLQKGPTPVPEAIDRCRDILELVSSDRRAAAMATRQVAQLQAMQGDFEEARRGYRSSRRALEDLGWAYDAAIVSLDAGPIELLAGDPAAAEAELRTDYEALTRMGDRNFVALTAALLAEALYRQGRFEESAECVAYAEGVASVDDLGAQVLWRGVTAKLAAREGDHERASTLIDEARRLIESTEDPSGQADLLVDLAEVRRLAGDDAGAVRALAAARDRYAVKGNAAGIRRIEDLLTAAAD